MEEPSWPTPRKGLARTIDDADEFSNAPGTIFQQHSINTPLIESASIDQNGDVFIQGDTTSEGGTSFSLSVFNLMNAILGSGILGLPYAMAKTGMVLFGCLLIAIALLANYSIYLLLCMCDLTGVKSYEEVGFSAMKVPGKLLAAGAIMMQNIGSMSSYLFIVKEELPEILKTLLVGKAGIAPDVWYLNGDYLVLLALGFIILPLACSPKIGFLGYTSGLSILCMVFFTIVVIVKKFSFPCPIPPANNGTIVNATYYTDSVRDNHYSSKYHQTSSIQTTPSPTNSTLQCTPKYFSFSLEIAYVIPTMAFSFVCHTAVLPIYTEISRPSRARMQNVATTSIAMCFIMYSVAATFGYLTFYDGIKDELLEGYSEYDENNKLILTVRLAVVLAIILTIPLVHYPTRKALLLILDIRWPTRGVYSWWRHSACTVFTLTVVTCLAIFVPNLQEIFAIVGATASCSLVFILPSLFYLLVGSENLLSRQKLGALALLVTGLAILATCLSVIIYSFVE